MCIAGRRAGGGGRLSGPPQDCKLVLVDTVQGIEKAVRKLSPAELADFRTWFAEFEAAAWDRQMETDIAEGRLDTLADEALDDFRKGRCTER